MNENIIWLTPPRFSGGLKSILTTHMRGIGMSIGNIRFCCLTIGMTIKQSKTKYTWDKGKAPIFKNNLDLLIQQHNPKVIVINDRATLGYITDKYMSLALCRGGVYMYKGIPCIVVDLVQKTKSTNTGSWILFQDLAKILRWCKDEQRHEPKFAYTVCRTLSDLQQFRQSAAPENCIAMACDIETSGRGRGAFITCSGYTLWDKSGKLHTWVVPFFNSAHEEQGNCHWLTEQDEFSAWRIMQEVNGNSVPKFYQNGSYDNTYNIRYRVPPVNWLYDTMNFFHAMWPEARKRLDFISSLCIDHYQYWKDEGKEDSDDETKGGAVPSTAEGMENYWRYNALDCHNTLLSGRFLLALILQPSMAWGLDNYIKEIRRVTGPAFAMSMRGVKINKQLKQQFFLKNTNDAFEGLTTLQKMVDDPEFNPNSPIQVKNLIYTTLRATPLPRKKDKTDEPTLKCIQPQNLILHKIIQQIWDAKKPANNASKYGENLWLWNGRWLYTMNGTGTETGRYSSKSHNLWIGTQIQNPPYEIRTMVEPDP
ncbi:MAG: hypothetical protein KAJ10_02695, partial [Thermodesulfovibrionia bacterium]|nr:hypothetical protein [Thermodesulfovibrionia bacterium]